MKDTNSLEKDFKEQEKLKKRSEALRKNLLKRKIQQREKEKLPSPPQKDEKNNERD